MLFEYLIFYIINFCIYIIKDIDVKLFLIQIIIYKFASSKKLLIWKIISVHFVEKVETRLIS